MNATSQFSKPRDAERLIPLWVMLAAISIPFALLLSPLFFILTLSFLVLSCYSGRDGFLLFGPFLKHELVRHSRKNRTHLWRILIALGVGVPIAILYFFVRPNADAPSFTISASRATMAGSIAFALIFWHLFLLSATSTMTNISQSIIEERETKRIEFILTTDLRGRELVAGKILSRMVAVLCYAATAVPLLVLLPLLFAVDWQLISLSLGFGAVTLVSIMGLSALGSVRVTTRKSAGNWPFMIGLIYCSTSWLLYKLEAYPNVWFFPGGPINTPSITFGRMVDWFSVGNPIIVIGNWFNGRVIGGGTGVNVADFPPYAAFHLTIGLLALSLAGVWVRRDVRLKTETKSDDTKSEPLPMPRPPVDDSPVFWKDFYCHPNIVKAQRYRRINRVVATVLLGIPLVCAITLALGIAPKFYEQGFLQVARYAPLLLAWVTIASSNGLAIDSIARERERDTMTNLILSDLSTSEIYFQKYCAVLRLFRANFVAQFIFMLPCIACGAYTWWGFWGLIVCHVVGCLFFTAMGLRYSANAPTAKAARSSNGAMILISIITLCIITTIAALAPQTFSFLKYVAVGLPVPVGLLATPHTHLIPPGTEPLWITSFILGMLLHLVWARWLYHRGRRVFAYAMSLENESGPMIDNRDRP